MVCEFKFSWNAFKRPRRDDASGIVISGEYSPSISEQDYYRLKAVIPDLDKTYEDLIKDGYLYNHFVADIHLVIPIVPQIEIIRRIPISRETAHAVIGSVG